MKLTKFKSNGTSKFADSPYGDDTFDFITINVPFREAHLTLQDSFILSRPLSKSIHKVPRRTEYLADSYYNSYFVLLDMDEIMTQSDCSTVINYFKNNNYNINLFTSRRFGTDRYTLKAFIKCSFPSTKDNIIATISMLNHHLEGLANIDEASYRAASYQANIPNVKQLHYKDNGVDISFDSIRDFIPKPVQGEEITVTDNIIQWFINYFVYNHQVQFKQNPNTNGTYQAMTSMEKTKWGYFWSPTAPWLLQHPNSNKNISALQDFYKNDIGKEYLKQENNKKLLGYFCDINVDISQNNKWFKVTQQEQELVTKFIQTPNSVCKVKGAMSSGKSNIISELIKQKSNKVLFITMRRSLSYDIKNKYNIKHYLEHLNSEYSSRYRIGDSLVIQLDSLYKIDVNDFDIIVIDEFESMCLHTQQNMQNSPYYIQNMKSLKKIFETKQLLILDAFLNNIDDELYFMEKQKFFIKNNYKDETNVVVYENKQTMIDKLIYCVMNKQYDEIITASFTTLNELEVVNSMLMEKNFKVAIINSKTTEDTKKMIYELFEEKYHTKYDVILFSPTITVGISIMNNVTHSFHYDEGKSVDTISSIQMTKRARLSQNIHIYIDGRYNGGTGIQTSNYNILVDKFKDNIKQYTKKDMYSLYYNPDTDTLSDIGLFNLKFLAHMNLYSSHHKDVFIFLCNQQFANIQYNNYIPPHTDFNDKLSELKKKQNIDNIYFLDDFNKNTYLDFSHYDELCIKQKLTKEEEQLLLLLDIKHEFRQLDDKDIIEIGQYYCRDTKFISKIKYLYLYLLNKKDKIDELLSDIVLNNINIPFCQQKEYTEISKFMIYLNNYKLKNKYSQSMIDKLSIQYKQDNISFSKFLNKIGYIKYNSAYIIHPVIYKYMNKLLESKETNAK